MNRHHIEHIKRRKRKKDKEKYDHKMFTNLNSFDEHMRHVHDAINSERYQLSSKKDCRLSLGLFVNGKQSNSSESTFQKSHNTADKIGASLYSENFTRDKNSDKEILSELEGLGKKAKYFLRTLFPNMKETPGEKNSAFLRSLKKKLEPKGESESAPNINITMRRSQSFQVERSSSEIHNSKGKHQSNPTHSAACQTSSAIDVTNLKPKTDKEKRLHFDSERPHPCTSRKQTVFKTSPILDEQRRSSTKDSTKKNRTMTYVHPLWDTPDALNDTYLNSSFIKSSYPSNVQDTNYTHDGKTPLNRSRTSLYSLPEKTHSSYHVTNSGHWNEAQSSEMQERLWRNIADLGSLRYEAEKHINRKC